MEIKQYTPIKRFYAWIGFGALVIVAAAVVVWVLRHLVCW